MTLLYGDTSIESIDSVTQISHHPWVSLSTLPVLRSLRNTLRPATNLLLPKGWSLRGSWWGHNRRTHSPPPTTSHR